MRIDWTHFTPWTSLAGGVTLGTAAALLLLLVGRPLGISGIVDGALTARDREFGWRATFLLGLLAASDRAEGYSPRRRRRISRRLWTQANDCRRPRRVSEHD